MTANELTGYSASAVFSAWFGALWLTLALYTAHRLSPLTLLTTLTGALLLIAGAAALRRRASNYPQKPEDAEIRQAFSRIKAFEWIAILAVSFLLMHWHLDLYIPSSIAAIVGLQFFPMARILGSTLHYLTGSLLTFWAILSLVLIPPAHLQSTACAGAGLIHWFCALLTLAFGFVLAHVADRALA